MTAHLLVRVLQEQFCAGDGCLCLLEGAIGHHQLGQLGLLVGVALQELMVGGHLGLGHGLAQLFVPLLDIDKLVLNSHVCHPLNSGGHYIAHRRACQRQRRPVGPFLFF